jgi:hypothetical protein
MTDSGKKPVADLTDDYGAGEKWFYFLQCFETLMYNK